MSACKIKYGLLLLLGLFCVSSAYARGLEAASPKSNQTSVVSNDSNSVTSNVKQTKEYLEEKQKRDRFIHAYRKKKQEELKAKQVKTAV